MGVLINWNGYNFPHFSLQNKFLNNGPYNFLLHHNFKNTQTYEVESTIFWQRSSKLKYKCQPQYPISTHKQPQFINKKVSTTNSGYERIEKDIQTIIESIKFRSSENDFPKKLKEDTKLINSSKNIFLWADKTQNFYEIMKKNYEKIIHENVTKKYKNADMSLPKKD